MRPLVSVCCLVYNQEKYIKETLDGFLMQKTDFSFEVLIHDDASKDGTVDIIKMYEQKYPDIIKPIFQEHNQYSQGISVTLTHNFPRAKGKYIAMCEGDDYWIDPLKLQKQVDFLEANEDFGLVHSDYNVYYDDSGEMQVGMNTSNGLDYNTVVDPFSQLLIKNHVATCTVLFKRRFLEDIDFIYVRQFSHLDLPLWFEMSQLTKFKYLNEPTAVYRVRGESMSNSGSKLKRLKFLIGSKKIKMDYSAKYGTREQTRKATYDYYHRVLINATYEQNRRLATEAFKQLPFKQKKDYIFYVFTRTGFLNTLFLKYRKPSQSY